MKHEGHVRRIGDVPSAQVSVESLSIIKHAAHVGDIGNIPGAYIWNQITPTKQTVHVCDKGRD